MSDRPYTVEKHGDEREWKRARLRGIGASEGSAVVRLSRFCSPFGLYVRKLEGRVEDDSDNAGGMADWGKRLESPLAQWFLEQHADTGMHLLNDPGDYTIFRSVERPHVFATLDRWTHGDLTDKEWRPLELKCAWYEAAKEWKDRVPVAYRVQMQQQLYVTGASEGFFAVLLNGCVAKWFREVRHEKFIRRLLDNLDRFWECVEKRTPPPVEGHRSDLSALFAMYPQSKPEAVELPEELQDAGAEWDKIAEQEKAIAARKDKLKARVQQAMGERALARCADDSGFSWKSGAKARTFRRVAKIGEPE